MRRPLVVVYGCGYSLAETPDEMRGVSMRILVAYEETYHSYRDAIVRAIKDHRPHFAVLEATLRELEATLERSEPHAVVCSRPSAEYPSGAKGAWVELPIEPASSGEICIGGGRQGGGNLAVGEGVCVPGETGGRRRRGGVG